jgi:hypothetical protein
MNAKEAIAAAKTYVADLYSQEGIANLGLEEVAFDQQHHQWLVTLGFSRSWEGPGALSIAAGFPRPRAYKVVTVADRDGDVVSIKNREGTA